MTHARGFSYVEVLVAMVLIAVAVPPAMRALHAGFDSVAAQERAAAQAWRAAGMMEPLLAELSVRHVSEAQVGEELEFAWWQSLLERTLQDNRALLGANTAVVDRLERDFRLVDEAHAAMGMASADELTALQDATGQEADCLFLELMIRHHEGAIPMTEALLELGSDPRALQVAQAMKDGQTAEIDAMQSMQARLGCG